MRRDRYLYLKGKSRSRRLINRFMLGADFSLDEAAQSAASAANYRNFCVDRGVLTDGWGIEPHPSFSGKSGIISAWTHFGKYMYCDTDGTVHLLDGGTDTVVSGMTFTAPPIAIDYNLYGEDVTLVCSSKDGMAVYDGSVLKPVEPSPKITAMALHYERLFVTTSNESDCVRFSDDLDPTNWAEGLDSGGFIRLADGYGRSNKVISFLNYVYIFRDYGISRMIAYADQSDFSVTNLYVSSGRIYPDSVTVCGDRVIFLASDGLYAFDGLDTTRILTKYGDLTPYKDSALGRYFDGKFYLAYSQSGAANDSLLVYDTAKKTAELSVGVRIDGFVGGDSLAALSGGSVVSVTRCGAVMGVPTTKLWRVPFNSGDSPDRLKRLEKIYVETATPLTIKVLCDGETREFRLLGADGVQYVKVGMRGRKIGLELITDSVGTRIAELGYIVY